jgi:octaprenyl-diphosphate synthase
MSGDQTAGDFQQAQAILRRRGAIAGSIDRARAFAEEAQAHLSALPANAYRDALEALAGFVVERAY